MYVKDTPLVDECGVLFETLSTCKIMFVDCVTENLTERDPGILYM